MNNIAELKKSVKDWGIVGAGGAGFPTHKKLDSRAHTIILNCAECEPLLNLHNQLLTHFTDEILTALCKVAEILEAKPIVAIKECYTEAINAVSKHLKVAVLKDLYPAGDEILLINEVSGVVVPPGTLPIESGFIVLNVETVYNIAMAKPVTHKWITIAGEVERPVTVNVPIGITIKEAVKYAGTVTTEDPVYIAGGPMMGCVADVSYQIKKNTNAIIVLPKGHKLTQKGNTSVNLNRASSACCQCGSCTEMCPRFLLGYPIQPHRIMRALVARDASSDAFKGVAHCSLCGLCEMLACPQSLSPRSLIKLFKPALHTSVGATALGRPQIADMPHKRISTKRLKMRLGLTKYDLNTSFEMGEMVKT